MLKGYCSDQKWSWLRKCQHPFMIEKDVREIFINEQNKFSRWIKCMVQKKISEVEVEMDIRNWDKEILSLASMKLIGKSNRIDRNCIRRKNGQVRLTEKQKIMRRLARDQNLPGKSRKKIDEVKLLGRNRWNQTIENWCTVFAFFVIPIRNCGTTWILWIIVRQRANMECPIFHVPCQLSRIFESQKNG